MSTRKGIEPVDVSLGEIKADIILEIISNETRRKILSILSEEPMYFNQLAKKLAIGQQAVLRHMESLERSGLVETYAERSTLGAPNRKYYKVKRSFNLNVSLSKNSFSLINREIKEIRFYDESNLFNDFDLESMPADNPNKSLLYLSEIFLNIEDQINDLEDRANNLRAIKQRVLNRLQIVCEDMGLESLERNILYTIIKRSPKDREDLINMMNVSASDLNTAIYDLSLKLDRAKGRNFLIKCLGFSNTIKKN
jgi:ArsR family transcriptional regulator